MAMENVGGIMRDLDAERKAYESRCNAIRLACDALRRNEIARVSARFEFESDEFYTADEKAELFVNTGQILPRS